MLRRMSLLVIDVFLVAVATLVAQYLRYNLTLTGDLIWPIVPYLVASLISASFIFSAIGTSATVWRLSSATEYLKLLGGIVAIVLASVSLTFAYGRMEGVSRSLPFLQGLVMLALLGGARLLVRLHYVWRMQRRGTVASPVAVRAAGPTVLVVGLNPVAELYVRAASEFGGARLRIAGFLGRSDRQVGRSAQGHAVLGTPENIAEVLRDLEVHGIVVDRIVVTIPRAHLGSSARVAMETVEKGTPGLRLVFVEDLLGLDAASSDAGEAGCVERGADAKERQALAPDTLYWRVKWVLDRVMALALLVLLSPLIAIVSLVVFVDVGTPVGFWQSRPGQFGRPFNLYKFRTMRPAFDGNGNRVEDIARSSLVGRFLRAARLDELPQLWNILVGEMAFIGPRPLLPIDQRDEDVERLLVLPGLTGWAQVTGGRTVSAREKAALDIWYVRNASFLLDLKIIVMTVRMVVFGETVDHRAIAAAMSAVGEVNGLSVSS